MRNFMMKFVLVFLVAIIATLSFGCIKTGEVSGAASVDTSGVAITTSDLPPPGATDQVDPEKEDLRAQLERIKAERAQSQDPAQQDPDPGQQAAPPASQPPPARGIPIPGIAGGVPIGTGVIMDGNIRMVTFRPLIVRPVFWVTFKNRTRPAQYLGIELVNGDDQLVPCNGKVGSWRPVIDVHTRQPVWILPPGSDACLTRPIANCPRSDDGSCRMTVRVVHYSFSANYAVRGYDREESLDFSPSTPGWDKVVNF